MKKMFVLSFAMLFVLCLTQPLVSQSLDWQIQFLRVKDRESMRINRTIPLENGDQFSLIVKADSDCYLYVFWYDTERETFLLHNEFLKGGAEENFDSLIRPFKLDEPSGTETIYVITSLSRQEELEKLIDLNENSPSRQNNNNLYREIVRLQNAASNLGEPAAAIITSGGTSRGAGETQNFATKFTGKETYVRAISIRH